MVVHDGDYSIPALANKSNDIDRARDKPLMTLGNDSVKRRAANRES